MYLGCHRLKHNKTSAFPQQVIFFDTETQADKIDSTHTNHSLKLGWGCYISYRQKGVKTRNEQWTYYTKVVDFNKWVLSKAKPKRKLYVMGSNVWFDMRVTGIDTYLLKHGFRNTRLYHRGLTTIIGFRKDDTVIMFLSIQNFLPQSIAKIGAAMGHEKLGVNFDTCTMAELKTYCRADTEILQEAFTWWRNFCHEHDLGVFGITRSSQAFNAYRHRFMPHTIYIHDNTTVIKLEREGYFGGRTECFHIGNLPKGQYHKLDINSLYPYVMTQHDYPTKLSFQARTMTLARLKRLLKNHLCMARVLVNIKEPYIAKRINNRTCFPVGRFECVVCTEVLKRLIKNRELVKVRYAAFYKGKHIFDKYIDFFNRLKEGYSEKGDKFGRSVSKYMMNTLYGKFGQRCEEVVHEEDAPLETVESYGGIDLVTNTRYWVVVYGGRLVVTEKGEKNGYNTFVAIAAHVTENARLFLWDSVQRAGKENSFYCDTDSLFTNGQGLENMESLLHDSKIGGWKTEDSSKHVVIRGPKDYQFGEETHRKGIRKNAVQVGDNKFEQDMFPTFRACIADKNLTGYVVKRVTKQLKGEYKKGTILDTGRVVPYIMNGGDCPITPPF